MAKRRRETTEEAIAKRIKEGRGAGRGAEYNPWLHIQDVPSKGLATRVKGWKTGRVHHLLSILELLYFYELEWSQEVVDTREQYPLLPLEETLSIAEACNIRHPADPQTKHPVVLTTDFVITLRHGAVDVDHARTVKYRDELNSKRTLEKLEIERRYWEARKIDWKIVHEDSVSRVLSKNVEWLHRYLRLEDFSALPDFIVRQAISTLTNSVTARKAPLRDITLQTDDQLGLEAGTSLSIARHLLATRRWLVDMFKPLNPGEKLMLLNR